MVLRGHDGPVTAVAISADNRWVVTGSDDNTARLWDLGAKDPAANPVVLRGLQEVIERDALVGAWWGRYPLEEHDSERVFGFFHSSLPPRLRRQ